MTLPTMNNQKVIGASHKSSSDFWYTPPRHNMKDLFVFNDSHSSPSLPAGPEEDDGGNSLGSTCMIEARSLGGDCPQPRESPSNCESNKANPSDGFLSASKVSISAAKCLVDQLKKGRSGNRPGSLKQRPNCLFLNHLGTRRASKTAFQAATLEAVLDIESSDFNDPACSFRIPEEVFCPLWDEHCTARGQDHPSLSVSKPDSKCDPIVVPNSPMDRRYFSDPNNFLSEESPQGAKHQARASPLVDDFIGMPSDHNANMPTDYAVMEQYPGYRVGVPTDYAPQDFFYPTESPIRRSNVIEMVGPPTDVIVEPSIDDPDGAGIGLVIPDFPSAGPPRAKQTVKKKVPSFRKCRFPMAESAGYPNTVQSPPYRRRVSSSLRTPQSHYPRSGSMPPSPVTMTRMHHQYPATVSPCQRPRTFTKSSRRKHFGATVSPMKTHRVKTEGLSSARSPSYYRRQSGSRLSPMPYSLAPPPLASSLSRRVRFSNPY